MSSSSFEQPAMGMDALRIRVRVDRDVDLTAADFAHLFSLVDALANAVVVELLTEFSENSGLIEDRSLAKPIVRRDRLPSLLIIEEVSRSSPWRIAGLVFVEALGRIFSATFGESFKSAWTEHELNERLQRFITEYVLNPMSDGLERLRKPRRRGNLRSPMLYQVSIDHDGKPVLEWRVRKSEPRRSVNASNVRRLPTGDGGENDREPS